ncbi:hypothetical protein TWF703_001740 [Orbilia oligospora]|uniref:Uncharacterized protein n=1 Tax=Orbilia oligospora TaxID=2813651 RepID=A0A7C8NTV2_ORBOL|nr:hypothetical protein TWF703_001740 [Orbilia oligospora]
MASKQPDESSFAPASLGFGQRTDFEETDASQNTFANNVDQHVGGPGILGTEEDIKRHEEVVSQLTYQGANYRAPGRRSPGKRPCQNRPTSSLHFSDQMRWVEIDLVKLWDRQIRESAMARRTLSSEYERLMAAMRQHADEHFGGEAAKPRGGPRTTLQWVVKNFDVSYYAEYPLRDIKLELRTNLRE